MKVKWNPESLIAGPDGPSAPIGDWLIAAERGEKIRVEIRPSGSGSILGRSCMQLAKAHLREGCIKVVESRLWPHPQNGRVLAEIHRRFDRMPDSDCGSAAWRSMLASIYDYAGAWALAARLLQSGLRVCVVGSESMCVPSDDETADVEIILPARS